MKLRLTLLSLVVTSLVGCAHNTHPKIPISRAESQLAAAANAVAVSLQELAAAQKVQIKAGINTDSLTTPEGGMGGKASIDWTGPVEPLVQKIADLSHYKMKVLGSKPAIPIIITIAQQNAVIADLLKNAGLQAGKRANIVVFPSSKTIELRYITT